MKITLYIISFLLTLSGCSNTDKEISELQAYEGPMQEAENVELFYSEAAQIKTKLTAKKMVEYQNGDREFPEGLYIEFYDEEGKLSSTLKTDNAYHIKEEDLWRGRGNVFIKNLEKNQELSTEELFWKPKEEEIFTEKFVTITLSEEVLYGRGLVAKQDFSTYELKNPEGTFYIDE